MRRAWRWTLNGLTVLSTLLCVATAGTWVRASVTMDHGEWWHSDQVEELSIEQGRIYLAHLHVRPPFGSRPKDDLLSMAERAVPSEVGPDVRPDDEFTEESSWHFLGIMYRRGVYHLFFRATLLSIPLVPLALALAVLPGGRYALSRRRRWLVRSGSCPVCRYNLAGNASGVCPECGTKMVSTAVR